MNIENGDYFVISRGFECKRLVPVATDAPWIEPPMEEKVSYDNSYSRLIFQAVEVCGQHVAARIVAASPDEWTFNKYIGKVMSLNLRQIEVMTVTEKYVKAVQGNVEASDAT